MLSKLKCPECNSKVIGFGIEKDGTKINVCRGCFFSWKNLEDR